MQVISSTVGAVERYYKIKKSLHRPESCVLDIQ